MGVYIQLTKPRQIDIRGKPTLLRPGDWAEVGQALARRLVAEGSATIPSEKIKKLLPPNSGLIVPPGLSSDSLQHIHDQLGAALAISEQRPVLRLPHARNLLWDCVAPLRPELIPVGLALVSRWQVASPLLSYDLLAAHVGTEAEQALTASIVHDLRVPLYDPTIVFMRRSTDSTHLLAMWAEEQARGENAALAFLRALYRSKPMLLALPPEWRTS